MATWEIVLTILGLAAVTVLTRSLFLLPERDMPLPGWVRKGLHYAPLAALAAIVVPEVVMTQGQLIQTLKDARLYAAAAGAAYYFWRRGILGTIVTGSAVLLTLKLGLGW